MKPKSTFGSCLCLFALALTACYRKLPQNEGNEAALRKQCLIAAGAIAGSEIELLQFGRFALNAPLDCVAGAPLPDVEQTGDGLLASRVLILRHQGDDWRVALDASKWVTNPEGYVGVDSLDDSYDFKGLHAVVGDRNPTGQPGITLWLTYLDENGEDEGEAKAFSLNLANGRYEEFDDRLGFKPEVKDPPHVRGK